MVERPLSGIWAHALRPLSKPSSKMTLSRGPGRGAEGVRPSSTRAARVRGASTSGVPESLQPPSGSIVAPREQLPDQGVDQGDSDGGGDVTPGARPRAPSTPAR